MDWEDDLLALAGVEDAAKPSKSHKSKALDSSKKRKRAKHADSSESDMDMSDDDNGSDAAGSEDNEKRSTVMYPLEGKFKDESDRENLMRMSEVDRESIIASRLDDIQRLRDMEHVRRMAKGVNNDKSTRTSARERKTTGKSDKRTSTLGELERKRESKKRKAEGRDDDAYGESKKKSASWSSSSENENDSDVNDSDDYDGGAKSKSKRGAGRTKKSSKEVIPEYMSEGDLRNVFIPRHELLRFWSYPWFSDFVTAAWARMLIGQDLKDPARPNVYRICQITKVAETKAKQPYKLENNDFCDVLVEVKHGLQSRLARLDEFSNGAEGQPFTKKEYLHLINTHANDKIELPLAKEVQQKQQAMRERRKAPKTDLDETLALRLRRALDPNAVRMNTAQIALAKTQLVSARRDNNEAEVARLEAALTAAGVTVPAADSAEPVPVVSTPKAAPSPAAKGSLASVSERNRQINRTEIRKAEMALQAQRRNAAQSGKIDPSARVKTTVRLMHDVRENTPDSTANTPRANGNGDILAQTAQNASTISALASTAKWEETAKNVQVDLDF